MSALIEIALDEGNAARALELLPRVERHAWRDYKQEVAEAAEKDHPQEALALYREMAERAIAERHRGAYQQAAQHLKRVKALSKRLAKQATGRLTYVNCARSTPNCPRCKTNCARPGSKF